MGFGDKGGGGALRKGSVFSTKLDDLLTLHLLSCSNLLDVDRDRTSICLHVLTAFALRDSLDFLTEDKFELLSLELLLELVPLDFFSSEEEPRSLMTSRMKDLTLARPFCFGVSVGWPAELVRSRVLAFGLLGFAGDSCFAIVRDFAMLARESATAFLVLARASATTLWLGRGGTGGGPFSLELLGTGALVCTMSIVLYYKRKVIVCGARSLRHDIGGCDTAVREGARHTLRWPADTSVRAVTHTRSISGGRRLKVKSYVFMTSSVGRVIVLQ